VGAFCAGLEAFLRFAGLGSISSATLFRLALAVAESFIDPPPPPKVKDLAGELPIAVETAAAAAAAAALVPSLPGEESLALLLKPILFQKSW